MEGSARRRKAIRVIELNRGKIDRITDRLIRLVKERDRAVIAIGKAKKILGIPVTDKKREAKIIESVKKKAARFGVEPEVVVKITRLLIQHSKKLE